MNAYQRLAAVLLIVAAGLLSGVVGYLMGVVPPKPPEPSRLSASERRDSLIMAEATRAGISPELMLAVARVENPDADTAIVSSAGAVGLLQVMPRYWAHAFEEECGCGPLVLAARNVCVGVRVFQFYLDSLGSVDRALRAYHGSDKPHLHQAGDGYVRSVLQAAFVRKEGRDVRGLPSAN